MKTNYVLKSRCCDAVFEDKNWELECPKSCGPSLIYADYEKKQIEVGADELGLYKFADWLPICRTLIGSASPVTYKSEGLSEKLGLENLYITFNGYWPEKGANMSTGSFKECEAYSICARTNVNAEAGKVMVVASAGNTARAFAHVCSENKIPLLLCVPEDNIDALWSETPIDPCVKLICSQSGSDYFDAIALSNVACEMDKFYTEGGAKNVARRDGMGTTVLSAVTTIGRIPDYYFQAVGSGTGAIAAWEANMRFLEDGRFGNNKMKLMVSQNLPFVPMCEAWHNDSRALPEMDEEEARKNAISICAKVLSNRKPPYGLKGGLYDCMKDAGGDFFAVTNDEAMSAAELFHVSEGAEIEPAAAVAVASLVKAVQENKIEKDATVMLNITGGGIQRVKREKELHYLKPNAVFPISATKDEIKAKLAEIFA